MKVKGRGWWYDDEMGGKRVIGLWVVGWVTRPGSGSRETHFVMVEEPCVIEGFIDMRVALR